jgi:glycogen debranching enzyme
MDDARAGDGAGVRRVPARPRPVIRATELGSVAVLKAGSLVLVADPRGDVVPDRRGLGLYDGDTRVLSTLALLVEDRSPTLLRADPGGAAAGVIQLTNPDLAADPTRAIDHPIALPRQSIGIRRERSLDDGALRERLAIANYTEETQRVDVRLVLDVDGADIFEVRGRQRPRRGALLPVEVEGGTVRFRYRALDGAELRTVVHLEHVAAALGAAEADDPGPVAARWPLEIPPGSTAALGWTVTSAWHETGHGGAPPGPSGTVAGTAVTGVSVPAGAARPAASPPGIPRTGATVETDDEIVNLILERAIDDLRLLRTPGPGPGEHFLAAGIPWFTTLFGRDSLIAAGFALPFLPELADDALTVLARFQARRDDPAIDAEPGKILHELRSGEMARTGELPFGRYYGSVDATPLWLMLLGETVAWTGDGRLVDQLWPAVLDAVAWLRDAPHDDDGFLVYQTRAEAGLRNQGWKDSADAIRDRHGRILDPPIALAEVQAYAVEARRRVAGLARSRGDDALAGALEAEATHLAGAFDDRFWQADGERYAMAIAAGGRAADALASNVGHCLWAGIVPPHRAAPVARALVAPPLFSGWGVRTYAADQPGFNPLGYHTGSVWPHDSAIAAAGLKRFGYHDEATAVAWAVLDAARRAPGFRLPELFCGFDRDAVGTPVVHPVACAPQAWSAAAALRLMTTMLGLVPRAPAGELEIVRPVLPTGLTRVVIRDLPVGAARLDLLFHRWRGTTSAEVLRRSGDVRVTVRL